MPEPIGLLHSTESATMGQARNTLDPQPGKQPHWLMDPRTSEEHEYIRWPAPAKALRNQPGGVETNNRPGGVLQVELVLHAHEAHRKPEQWYQNAAKMLKPKLEAAGITLEVPYPWVPSPIPKGTDPRLSPAAWYGLVGIIGHQRVPENDHSDPGDLARLNKYLLKETTVLRPMLDLPNAMQSMNELYLVHRGHGPSTDEAQAWRTEMARRARLGEDLEPVLRYIDWSLGLEA